MAVWVMGTRVRVCVFMVRCGRAIRWVICLGEGLMERRCVSVWRKRK